MNRLSVFYLFVILCSCRAADSPFVVEPYIQLGDAAKIASSESMEIRWHTVDVDQPWEVQSRKPDGSKWMAASRAEFTRVAVRGIEPHRVYRATVKNLAAGEEFDYRVTRAG